MKTTHEDTIRKHNPYTGSRSIIKKAESEKEAQKLGFRLSYGGGNGDGGTYFEITMEEIFRKMLKRFRIMYIPNLADMVKDTDPIIGDEELIKKMLKVADESANEIFDERLPEEIAKQNKDTLLRS